MATVRRPAHTWNMHTARGPGQLYIRSAKPWYFNMLLSRIFVDTEQIFPICCASHSPFLPCSVAPDLLPETRLAEM